MTLPAVMPHVAQPSLAVGRRGFGCGGFLFLPMRRVYYLLGAGRQEYCWAREGGKRGPCLALCNLVRLGKDSGACVLDSVKACKQDSVHLLYKCSTSSHNIVTVSFLSDGNVREPQTDPTLTLPTVDKAKYERPDPVFTPKQEPQQTTIVPSVPMAVVATTTPMTKATSAAAGRQPTTTSQHPKVLIIAGESAACRGSCSGR